MGLIPKQQFHGFMILLFHLGYAGHLASDRMNELRNEKVKVEFNNFFPLTGRFSFTICKGDFWG